MRRPSMQIGLGIALGAGIGAALAVALGSGSAWLGIGIAIGGDRGGNVERKKGILTGLDAFNRYGMTNVVRVFPLLSIAARSGAPSSVFLRADG